MCISHIISPRQPAGRPTGDPPMTIETELSAAIAEIEAERNARKAYRAALAKVRAMRKAGASVATVFAWANAWAG